MLGQMISKLLRAGFGLGLLALGGCAKKEEVAVVAKPEPPRPAAVELVRETERSRHFMAVSRELELGGTLYAYADVDGDMLKLAQTLHQLGDQLAETQPQIAPFAKQDFAALFTILGLNDVKAFGLSSVPDGTGFFRNRAFFYTPQQRHGLMGVFGGAAGPFTKLNLAPADADFFSEGEADFSAVYASLKAVTAKVGGEATVNLMEAALQKAGEEANFPALDLINGLKGRSVVVLRLDPQHTLKWPGEAGVTTPGISLLIGIDGIGSALENALTKSPLFAARQEGTLKLFELKTPLPIEGIKPVIAVEGTTLFAATSAEFLAECRQQKTGLAQNADFQTALSHVGNEGNALTYVSPAFFTHLRQLESMNPTLPEPGRKSIATVLNSLPKPDRPLITVRINRPDGILVRSYWNRSLKQDVAVLAVYNPVTIGFLAAMAIPAFQKVRDASQEKAVLNNLRQLDAAADQYYLEHDVTVAIYEDLVGPDKYIKELTPVAGEDYTQIILRQNQPLRVKLSSGKIIQYPMNGQRPAH
jgi:hypothetical protein